MPLGERKGCETSDSRFCGIETDFSYDGVASLLVFNTKDGLFDFVLAPLMDPSYTPSLCDKNRPETRVLPLAGSELIFSTSKLKWKSRVTGLVSSWIDLDSGDEISRKTSEITLKHEIEWAKQLTLRSLLLPTPKWNSCANYARCVKQILQGLTGMELWIRVPLMDSDTEYRKNSWERWNSFRLLCEHDSRIYLALDVGDTLPSQNALERWFGEPVKAAIISTECFIQPTRQPNLCLPESYQELITRFFNHDVQVILSPKPGYNLPTEYVDITYDDTVLFSVDMQTHPYKAYLDYLKSLFCNMEPLSEQECREVINRDRLQPQSNSLEAHSYEMIERNSVKYIQYQKAIAKALVERVPKEKASELTIVLIVVGAGRGSLVRASLQAARETGRKLKIYAIEKNPYAVVQLDNLVKRSRWEATVTIISSDMRTWRAPEKADILVSELLGSFGDNELSPECLDGAQRFLKLDGISIPSTYTTFIQPITASKLYNNVKALNDPSYFETAYSVRLHSVARLAPSQPLFTFTDADFSRKPDNQRYKKKLRFDLPIDMGSSLVHGFAGYFEAVLYEDLRISNEPTTATPNLSGCIPIFFPLQKPVEVHNSLIEALFWRRSNSTKVWYEWSVFLPSL